MKNILYIITILFTVLLVGCSASMPPPELVNARLAYQRASTGQAAQLVPADLHKAQTALDLAEKAFLDDPDSYQTADLAYVADRKARLAEALAATSADNASTAKAKEVFDKTQAELVKNKTEQLAVETQARIDAEKVAANALDDLAKLAAVKEESRGLVITLSGGVLFESNKSTLFPTAQDKLNKVAEALLTNKNKKIIVEGHTDSQGSSEHNQALSQKRAEAVRAYLITRGYPENLIQASGIGENRPVASNDNTEGRANNRRVEIVVDNSTAIIVKDPTTF
jgi:outer membrane protein OmpA-like peptidoglycan-associated protein